MKLNELGEFGLIRRIAPHFASVPSGVVGIGDDCAVLPLGADRVQLVTTDLLIEDIHFLRHRIAPDELGHKALAVNLSDIAAMGGTPTAAFLSLGLPKDLDIAWLDSFFAGLQRLGEECNCPLLGGDTTKSSAHMVINVAVLGEAPRAQVKYRSGARAGDVVAVTGVLGDSGAGLRLLLDGASLDDDDTRQLVQAHHRPAPHLREGAWLARHEAVHAMMDVSDGVDSDLRHIMEQSHVGAVVELDALPVSSALRRVCDARGWPAHELAAAAGEDYCLLCTVAADAYDEVASAFASTFGRPLCRIGVADTSGVLTYHNKGKPATLHGHGFDHFAS